MGDIETIQGAISNVLQRLNGEAMTGMCRLGHEIINWLRDNIPDAVISRRGGRPPAEKRRVIEGIF